MDAVWICPRCGQPETLIALGARRDYPHRWRWWVSTLTQLYLCDRCDALVALDAAQIPTGDWLCVSITHIMARLKKVSPTMETLWPLHNNRKERLQSTRR